MLFLSSCSNAPITQPITVGHESTQAFVDTILSTLTPASLVTHTPVSTASPSATRQFSATPRSTKTLLATATSTTRPTIPPTFDVASVVKRTASPPAHCPVEMPEMVPDFEYSEFLSESVINFRKQILEFLNAGGTRQAVITAYHRHDSRVDDRIIQEKDLTGDGLLELLLTDYDSVNAFICQKGQYQVKNLVEGTYHFSQPVIFAIKDMNLDGVDEIITIEGDDRVRIVSVIEWNNGEFQILNQDPSQKDACSGLLGPSWPHALDIDNNGTLELVLKQTLPIWTEYRDGLPWRKETRTCAWNGKFFSLTHTELALPEYRFQAVQDGDRATIAGEYDQALDFYQQAIFSDKLDWWSDLRRQYESNLYDMKNIIKPAPEISMFDPVEFPNLAAYARYRIMLLHIKRGFLPEAQIVYATLQEKFPQEQVGHAYAEMATAFWDEYQLSQSLELACEKAIEYAASNPEDILANLGNSKYTLAFYGYQSLYYVPEDICPFR